MTSETCTGCASYASVESLQSGILQDSFLFVSAIICIWLPTFVIVTLLLDFCVVPWPQVCFGQRQVNARSALASHLLYFPVADVLPRFETPEHVFLQCMGVPELILICSNFLASAAVSIPGLHPLSPLSNSNAMDLLKQSIFSWTAVPAAAKFIHRAIQIWSLSLTRDQVAYGSEGEDSDSDETYP
jgi:hypothetical protein